MSNKRMSADVAMSVLRAHAEVARVSDEHGLHADMMGCAEVMAALIAERDAMREFARWTVAESAFCGGDIDGGDVQDKAQALGIIREVQVTEPCRESCACAEFGFPTTCYRFAWAIESEKS